METAVPPLRDHDAATTARSAALIALGNEQMLLAERIANSEPFQKSSRLPALLRYLAACTLQGNRAGLTEQAIGRAVFDKPADFYPAEDSSVRVYVRQLRLRLYEYFQSAGQDEPVIIEIPKGGYLLAFHLRHTPSAAHEPEIARRLRWRWRCPLRRSSLPGHANAPARDGYRGPCAP